jgi:hypothetical protein
MDNFSNYWVWNTFDYQGEVSELEKVETEDGVEYLVFKDGKRASTQLIGDIISPIDDFSAIEIINLRNKTGEYSKNNIPIGQSASLKVESQQPQHNFSIASSIIKSVKKEVKNIEIIVSLELPKYSGILFTKDNFDISDEEIETEIKNMILLYKDEIIDKIYKKYVSQ